MNKEPIKYEPLTQQLILFAKRHYNRTNNTIDDLATFMFHYSWSPKKYNTERELYRIVAEAFVECCSKHDITTFIRGIANPIDIHLFQATIPTIPQLIESMLGLISCIQVRERDAEGNWYDLIELPEVDQRLMVITPDQCKTCQHLTDYDSEPYCNHLGKCTDFDCLKLKNN